MNWQKKGFTYNYNAFYSVHAKYYSDSYITISIRNDPGLEIIRKALILSE